MEQTGVQDVLRRVLAAAREELGMDVAWVSRFEAGQQVLAVVEGDTEPFGISDGSTAPLEGSYCTRVVAGELPTVIPDALADPRTASLPITETLGIGSYAGVPIRLPNGEVFGMLCCVGRGAIAGVSDRNVRFLQLLAEAAATEIIGNEAEHTSVAERRGRVEAVIDGGRVFMVAQPVVELSTMRTIGAEALARFDGGGGPDVWFSEAAAVGLGVDLELLAARKGIAVLEELPDGVYVAVNASPVLVMDPRFTDLIVGSDAERIVIEVTEHARVPAYEELAAALAPMRAAGARLAVDDAGAGYASLRHILALHPDIIKLDIALTSGIDSDPVRQALAAALVDFAGRLSATLVAEGVETQAELDHLLRLGFDAVQGYYLAKPGQLPLPTVSVQPTARATQAAAPREPLAALAQRTAHAPDLDSYLGAVLDAVIDLTGMDCAYVSRTQADQLVRTHVRNTDRYAVRLGTAYPWRGSLCQQCQDAAILWTADAANDLLPGPHDTDITTFLSVPLMSPSNEVVGTLCAISTDARYLSDPVIAQMQMLARLVAERIARGDD